MSTVDIEKLVQLIAAGIRVFRTRDGKPITDEECLERARNIATQVIVEFELRRLPGVEGVPERIDEGLTHPKALPAMKVKEWARLDFDIIADPKMPEDEFALRSGTSETRFRFPKVAELRELYMQGKPQGHGHSCACRDCRIFNQGRRAQ